MIQNIANHTATLPFGYIGYIEVHNFARLALTHKLNQYYGTTFLNPLTYYPELGDTIKISPRRRSALTHKTQAYFWYIFKFNYPER